MTTGILTDYRIRESVNNRTIVIEPYRPEHVNPTSYDLTLGDEVAVYEKWVETYDAAPTTDGRYLTPLEGVLDAKEEPRVKRIKMTPEYGFVLKPGIGYLMHTAERVATKAYVPILDGKSSIGRLFIQVHATAGYGDPGFDGQFTLEVIVQHPVRVYPGMRICQIRFQDMNGLVQKPYDQTGHYTGEAARGAVPSQAWRQFSR